MRTRRLIVVTPEGERELLFIGRLLVGRAPECDISLADTKISRRHAEFDASGPTPRVTDLGSRNGILVNGRKVGAADLAPGDVVTAGDARIRFEERAAETSEPAEPAPASTTDDRTAVLMPPSMSQTAEPSGPMPIRGASLDPDKTSVMPPPGPPPGPIAAAPPAPSSGPPPSPPPGSPSAVQTPSGHESAEHTLMLTAPPRAVVRPAAPAAPDVRAGRLESMPVASSPARPAVAVRAVAPAAARPGAPAGVATDRALQGPRVSWGGLVTLAAMAHGGLSVLLGVLLGTYVALIVSLALAMLIAMLITRQTRTTLQHFTRQVELVVSGASPNVMQGGLMPGLDGLPGVVTYLLERKTGDTSGYGAGPSMLFETDDPDLGPSPQAVPFDPGPPWLVVTPALMIAASSGHGPDAGASAWASANGRHLLDVLESGPTCNAVVQGLGALGMQAGAEVTVPLVSGPPIALRRESSGDVRVTLGCALR